MNWHYSHLGAEKLCRGGRTARGREFSSVSGLCPQDATVCPLPAPRDNPNCVWALSNVPRGQNPS